jgi:hypothetical protein
MCTVFTNDSYYISARDDLLAVNYLFNNRKQQIMIMGKLRQYLLDK